MQNPAITESQQVALSGKIDEKGIIAQVKTIQKIMSSLMQEGVHYGKIPGCDQNSLYKPGSETLLSAFKISVEPEVNEIRGGDHITYKVRAFGRHMTSGIVVGIGVGEASTAEDKYAWRAAVCDEEFEETPEDRRRIKWSKKKGFNGTPDTVVSVKQVRTNPADIANTVLKMAKKRAQVDMTLTSLAASDIFTQDLEDLPDEYVDGMQSRAPVEKKNRYQAKEKNTTQNNQAAAPGMASPAQVGLLKKRLEINSMSESDLLAKFEIGSLDAMPKAKVNEALEFIGSQSKTA